MKLAVFNGSPRGKGSNTRILLDKFLMGYDPKGERDVSYHYLIQEKDLAEQIAAYQQADTIILAFPLYTDSMPGMVKQFIEAIGQTPDHSGKRLGFIVQSGFPESKQSTFVARYLEKLTMRLGCEYLGTVIRGGVEGIQIQPPKMTANLFSLFENLGKKFADNETFDEDIMAQLAKSYELSKSQIVLYKFLSKLGVLNFYWNMNLKQNDAYERRFDQPYL
jgi:NAD(P)H-dependent FMN reductase